MDWKHIVKELRDKTGKSQFALAAELGCSQSTLSEIELGVIKDPRSSIGIKLLEIARMHGVKAGTTQEQGTTHA